MDSYPRSTFFAVQRRTFITNNVKLEYAAEARLTALRESAQRIHLLGLQIQQLTMAETLQAVGEFVESRRFGYGVTPNVDHTVKLRDNAQFRDLYKRASLVVADGVPGHGLRWLLGTPLKQRINGTDLFERTCQFAAERGYSVFLLGKLEIATSACAELMRRHPTLKIVGSECPPMGFYKDDQQNKAIQGSIRTSGADILFVDCPHRSNGCAIMPRLRRLVCYWCWCVVQLCWWPYLRAPVWMQRNGLEWLWRLAKEPRRLWKRYLLEDLPFFGQLLRAMLKRQHWHVSKPRGDVTFFSYAPI